MYKCPILKNIYNIRVSKLYIEMHNWSLEFLTNIKKYSMGEER